MKQTASFLYSKVQFSNPGDNHLVISLQAPAVAVADKRRPLCIIATIDISGSMGGAKIDYARKSVLKLIEHMGPGDLLGVVQFGSQITVMQPPVEMTQEKKDQLKTRVNKITANGGGTNFSGAMIAACEAVNALDLPVEYLTRVIMFTDGQANEGIAKKKDEILSLSKNIRGRASISGFGYGNGSDNDMLSGLATESDGNFAFIANPDDALSAFGKELGGLTSVYAQDIVVEVIPSGDHEIVQVVSDVDVDETKDGVKVKLSDILAEERRDIVIEVKLASQKKTPPRAVNVVDLNISYKTLEDGRLVSKTESLKAKLEFSKERSETPDKRLSAIVDLAKLANAQAEAEKQAQAGNFAAAQVTLNSLAKEFRYKAGGQSISNTTEAISAMYHPDSYAISSGDRNSSRGLVTRATATSSVSSAVGTLYSAVLEDAGATVSNSTQSTTTTSFTTDKP